MNRPFRACSSLSRLLVRRLGVPILPAFIGALCIALPAMGQPAPTVGGAPPAAAPQSSAPTSAMKINPTPTKAEIDAVAKFITERVAVVGTDSGTARDELVNGTASGSVQNPATPAYLLNYTTNLNKEVLQLLAKSKDTRVRLNIAIVVAKVAANSQNAWLQPAVEKLLSGDSKETTVLWGMKAAGAILPQPGVRVDTLLKAMLGAVASHANSGAIADEAYTALKPTLAPPTKETIAALQAVFQARTEAYKTSVPEEPAVDQKPCVALTDAGGKGMWTLSSPAEQMLTMKLIHNLLASAAVQADTASPGDTRDQLIYLIKQSSVAVLVVGTVIKDDVLVGAAKSVSQIPTNIKAGDVAPAVAPELAAIRAAFKLPVPPAPK